MPGVGVLVAAPGVGAVPVYPRTLIFPTEDKLQNGNTTPPIIVLATKLTTIFALTMYRPLPSGLSVPVDADLHTCDLESSFKSAST